MILYTIAAAVDDHENMETERCVYARICVKINLVVVVVFFAGVIVVVVA